MSECMLEVVGGLHTLRVLSHLLFQTVVIIFIVIYLLIVWCALFLRSWMCSCER